MSIETDGSLWPQVGVECEFSQGPGGWLPCKVIGKYEGFVWLMGANVPLCYRMIDIKFRTIRTLWDDAKATITTSIYNNCSVSPAAAESVASEAVYILRAKYELKEKADA